MMLKRIRERTQDSGTRLLIIVAVALVTITVAAQLGIRHGRDMGRQEAAAQLAEADARAQRLGDMLSVA